MNKFGGLAVIISLAVAVGATASETPTHRWSAPFVRPFGWVEVSGGGVAVVGTDEALLGLDLETGRERWRREEWKATPEGHFHFVPGTRLALIEGEAVKAGERARAALLDLTTGAPLWALADSTSPEVREWHGGALLRPVGALLLAGRSSLHKDVEVLCALDMRTGHMRWHIELTGGERPPLYRIMGRSSVSGHQPPTFDTDSTFVLAWGDNWVKKLNARTGATVWSNPKAFGRRATVSPAPILGNGVMFIDRVARTLYIPRGTTLAALRLSDGAAAWPDPAILDATCAQIAETPSGIAVGMAVPIDDEADEKEYRYAIVMLDRKTGRQHWKAPDRGLLSGFFAGPYRASHFLVRDDGVWVAAEGRLRVFALATGVERQMEELPWEDSLDPETGFDFAPDGLVVASSHVIACFDSAGHLRGSASRTAPQGGVSVGPLHVVPDAKPRAYDPVPLARFNLSSARVAAWPGVDATFDEFKPAARGDLFAYLVSDRNRAQRKVPTLVRFRRTDASEAGEAEMGEKPDDYSLDEVNGQILLFTKDRLSIVAVPFHD